MTLQEFFNKYNGKGIDFDNSFGNQCVDLYRQYLADFGYPQSPPVKGAAWIRYTYDPKLFTWFDNTILAVPKAGDILIWDQRAGGGFGHVAIYVSGNILSFTSFDLNWPSQGYYDKYGNFIGTGVAHYQGHNYFGGLVGWLRPTVNIPPQSPESILKAVKEIVYSSVSPQEKIDKLLKLLE